MFLKKKPTILFIIEWQEFVRDGQAVRLLRT
jgi:hypothetical protein